MAVAYSSTSRSAPVRPLLTGVQVGEVLGYTPRQIRALAAAGELRRVVLGHRSTRYLAEDVEAYIERHIAPSTSEASVITPRLRDNSGEDTASAPERT